MTTFVSAKYLKKTKRSSHKDFHNETEQTPMTSSRVIVPTTASSMIVSSKTDDNQRRSKRFRSKVLNFWDFERISSVSTDTGDVTVVIKDVPGEGTIILDTECELPWSEKSHTFVEPGPTVKDKNKKKKNAIKTKSKVYEENYTNVSNKKSKNINKKSAKLPQAEFIHPSQSSKQSDSTESNFNELYFPVKSPSSSRKRSSISSTDSITPQKLKTSSVPRKCNLFSELDNHFEEAVCSTALNKRLTRSTKKRTNNTSPAVKKSQNKTSTYKPHISHPPIATEGKNFEIDEKRQSMQSGYNSSSSCDEDSSCKKIKFGSNHIYNKKMNKSKYKNIKELRSPDISDKPVDITVTNTNKNDLARNDGNCNWSFDSNKECDSDGDCVFEAEKESDNDVPTNMDSIAHKKTNIQTDSDDAEVFLDEDGGSIINGIQDNDYNEDFINNVIHSQSNANLLIVDSDSGKNDVNVCSTEYQESISKNLENVSSLKLKKVSEIFNDRLDLPTTLSHNLHSASIANDTNNIHSNNCSSIIKNTSSSNFAYKQSTASTSFMQSKNRRVISSESSNQSPDKLNDSLSKSPNTCINNTIYDEFQVCMPEEEIFPQVNNCLKKSNKLSRNCKYSSTDFHNLKQHIATPPITAETDSTSDDLQMHSLSSINKVPSIVPSATSPSELMLQSPSSVTHDMNDSSQDPVPSEDPGYSTGGNEVNSLDAYMRGGSLKFILMKDYNNLNLQGEEQNEVDEHSMGDVFISKGIKRDNLHIFFMVVGRGSICFTMPHDMVLIATAGSGFLSQWRGDANHTGLTVVLKETTEVTAAAGTSLTIIKDEDCSEPLTLCLLLHIQNTS